MERGKLVCVEFPSTKPPSTGGPPYGLPGKVYRAHLGQPGVVLGYDGEDNLLVSEEEMEGDANGAGKGEGNGEARGLACLTRYQPQRTHEIGRGKDWVSVWAHRSSHT